MSLEILPRVPPTIVNMRPEGTVNVTDLIRRPKVNLFAKAC